MTMPNIIMTRIDERVDSWTRTTLGKIPRL